MPAAADSTPLTLTTSEPIARALRREHALDRKRAGVTSWEVPAIHDLRRWCREQWLQTWPDQQLLHAVQELALWQRAIETDGAASRVLSPGALAREARSMGRLVSRYGIDLANAARYTEEQRAFYRWHGTVRETLRESAWLTESELPGVVAALVRTGDIAAPPVIRLAGAPALLTPQERGLITALEQAGSQVVAAESVRPGAVMSATRHADANQQFQHLAATVRDCLLQSTEGPEGPADILIACPDPQARRGLIEGAFLPLLAPWLQLPGAGQRPVPWRFANGRSLDQHPLVAVALVVCRLTESSNRLDELSRLLLASALWTPEQREWCARADFILRDLGGTQFPLRLLARHVPEPLGMRFQSLLEGLRAEPRRALPSAWVQHFERRLQHLAWPGERPLGSADFQAREHWDLALATFSAMDQQLGAIAQGAALGWLQEIVSSRPFEPRADHDQPVLILTPLEAAGLRSDYLFMVDATDDVLPARPRRYPLLAIEALVRAAVPDATPDAALAASTQLVAQLRAQATHIHLSHAQVDERGAHCQATPLFGPALAWQEIPAASAQCAAERAADTPRLAWPDVDPVPPVEDPAAEGIFGGTGIFKDFVEAPFFAFCKYRLGIRPLPEAPAGIPPRAQGLIAHAVLEQAWRALRTQAALLASSDQSLGALIDQPLDEALQKHLPPDRFGPVLRQMERARLRDIVLQWLAHEKRRTEPFEVIDCEERVDMIFAGLSLRLIIDRVDRVQTRLGDERYLILDYKTGREAETRGWSADRLSEPQLPLYAASASLGELGIARVDGIAFAHLKDGHPALVPAINWGLGLIDEKARFRMHSWPEQLEAWRTALGRIAQGFLAGEAGLGDPQRYRYSFNRELLDLVREAP